MRSTRKALFLTLILLATVLQLPLAMGESVWLAGWDYRVKITIDSGDVNTVLTDFPVLIYLSGSSGINGEDITFVFDEVGANSLKIAVTLSDGTTECYVEVEGWEFGDEEAWLWTKIASISNTTDTEIYLYYDNDHADNVAKVGATGTAPAQAVWDADFAAIWHMSTGADNEVDSTGNGHTLTEFGQIDQIDSKIGYGRDFLGSADYFEFTDADLGIGAGPYTFESWFNNDADSGRIIYTYNVDTGIFITTYNDAAGSFDVLGRIFVAGVSVDVNSAGTPYNDDTWYYIVYTRDDSDDLELLMDNASVDTGTKAGSIDGGGHGHVGSDLSHTADFDGIIDEMRMSTSFRSTAWKQASYESGLDHILDFGSEEEATFPYIPTNLFGAGFNNSTPYVSLYWTSNLTNVDFFEVQNSTDKISWGYLGANNTFEYHDFQVVNGTERYYRVRACNFDFEYGSWFNSTFTNINFETVYFVESAAAEVGDTIIMGGSGVFWIILIIIVPIVAYMLKKG